MRRSISQLRRRAMAAAAAAGLLIVCASLEAQQRRRALRPPAATNRAQNEPDTIVVNYPDSVNLAAFVDYVSQSLDVKIIYGDEVRTQTVVFRPGEVEVPKSQLLELLRSMLRMQGLALVDGDVSGWLRIVRADDMQRFVSEIRDSDDAALRPTNRVVTHVVRVVSEDLGNVAKYARMFLSSGRASVIEVPEQGLLIITDYESAVRNALEVVKLVDVPRQEAEIVSVKVGNLTVDEVAQSVTKILSDKAKLEGRPAVRLAIHPQEAAGRVLLVGPGETVEEAKRLIERLEGRGEASVSAVTYAPMHVPVERLNRLIEKLIKPQVTAAGEIETFADEATNRLYVTGPEELHARIRELLETEDVKGAEASRPVRIYRPKHRRARDLVGMVSMVLPEVTDTEFEASPPASGARERRGAPGPNRPPAPPGAGQAPPMPPAQEPIGGAQEAPGRIRRIEGRDFSLAVDDHTNAMIAVGPAAFHAKLSALIAELDQRQAQVLIEMTLVAITFNDSLSLAVELANAERHGADTALLFSSFGLSSIDLTTGMRAFNPGAGINGVLMGPEETPFLLRAIAAHGNSRIITTPKLVVSDNTSATLGSVEEAPFTSINASDTVATTSFAGFESAGTTLTVTPHIAQGDHLSLDYSFTFSNFTGGGSVGVPPPRTTNTFNGTVEVPDGHTIIVGGLVTENEADSVTEVPLLGRIPVLGVLFQSSDRARTKSRIYAFIRPTILRDDEFADLKLISLTERERAALADRDFPESELQWMR